MEIELKSLNTEYRIRDRMELTAFDRNRIWTFKHSAEMKNEIKLSVFVVHSL